MVRVSSEYIIAINFIPSIWIVHPHGKPNSVPGKGGFYTIPPTFNIISVLTDKSDYIGREHHNK